MGMIITPDDWDCQHPYDPQAEKWQIDGLYGRKTYLAYLCYVFPGDPGFEVDTNANTCGNVIYLSMDVFGRTVDAGGSVEDTAEYLKQHEAQHVIQHYEFGHDGFLSAYVTDKLAFEKEACARQIIKGTLKTHDYRESMMSQLTHFGMSSLNADRWITEVLRTKCYPGVTHPRMIPSR